MQHERTSSPGTAFMRRPAVRGRRHDNVGLGMWSQEIQAGTTVYLDSAKKVSAAATAYVEFHSNKKDQDLKAGNLLTLEGGAAYNVPKIGGAFVKEVRHEAHRGRGRCLTRRRVAPTPGIDRLCAVIVFGSAFLLRGSYWHGSCPDQ